MTSRRLTPSRYSLMTRFSPRQTGSVAQSSLRGQSAGSCAAHGTGARSPSVRRRMSPTVYYRGGFASI